MIALLASALLQAAEMPVEAFQSRPHPDVADYKAESSRAAHEYVRAGRDEALATSAVASLTIDHDMAFTHSVVSFHRRRTTDANGAPTSLWSARLRSADGASVTTRYADSRTCPAIGYALVLAERLERPTLDFIGIPLGGLPTDPGGDIMLDDATYTLEATGTYASSKAFAKLSMSGDSLSPVGAWARMTEASLAPCWSQERPVAEDTGR